jgi:hypothetical protein
VRNIPKGFKSRDVITNLEADKKFGILNCSTVMTINEKQCAVLTVQDIEEAERLCLTWHAKKATENNYLKVNVHPYSYRKRPAHKKSHLPLFDSLFVEEKLRDDEQPKL